MIKYNNSRFNIKIKLKNSRLLIFNSYTNAMALFSPDEVDEFEKIEKTGLSSNTEFLSQLKKAGFLVDSNIDELERINKEFSIKKLSPGSMTLTIMPTINCNFACDYCFQGENKENSMMKDDVIEAILSLVEEKTKKLLKFFVTWYGGEPLLGMKVIRRLSKEFIRICDKRNIHYSAMIITNGWLLDNKIAAELMKLRVGSAQVTLDGPPEFHDKRRPLVNGKPSFERILNNIKDVSDNCGLPISVRVNIDERNFHSIKSLLDIMETKGLSNRGNVRVYFAPIEATTTGCHSCAESSMGKMVYGELETELNEYAFEKGLSNLPNPPQLLGVCAAIKENAIIILPDGDLHKCWETVSEKDLSVGNILKDNIPPDNKNMKKWENWSPFNVKECISCNILASCAGFCAYKHIYSERTLGEAAKVPCPSWKYNIRERLILRAYKLGFINKTDF